MALIMYLDDDHNKLFITKQTLERHGHRVLPVHSVPLAQKSLEIMPFEMIICDSDIGRIGSGSEFAKKAKSERKELKIILIASTEESLPAGIRVIHDADWDLENISHIVAQELSRKK